MEAENNTPSVFEDGGEPFVPNEAPVEAAPAPEPQAVEPAPAPDLNEQMTALMQEVQSIRQGLPAQEPEPERDLFDRLSSAGLDPEPVEGAPNHQGYENPALGDAGQVDPFDALVRERVAEAMYPIQQQYEMEKRRGQLNELAQTHKELLDPEYQEAIADRLAPLVERYGDEMLLTDPMQVEMALIAEKAERASAAEVPAEQAVNQGARLETNAAASGPGAQDTPEDAIKKGILAARVGGDAFT